jgi:hypothetical protein
MRVALLPNDPLLLETLHGIQPSSGGWIVKGEALGVLSTLVSDVASPTTSKVIGMDSSQGADVLVPLSLKTFLSNPITPTLVVPSLLAFGEKGMSNKIVLD